MLIVHMLSVWLIINQLVEDYPGGGQSIVNCRQSPAGERPTPIPETGRRLGANDRL